MKNKTFILIFLFILQLQSITFADNSIERDGLINKTTNYIVATEENKKKNKLNKRLLKKEIKRRKRYHKSLLYLYNKSFEKQILYDITQNSLIINSLREFYKK